jgi:hypothetical protein
MKKVIEYESLAEVNICCLTMVSMKPDLFWKIGERGVAPNGRILRGRYTESLWSYRKKYEGTSRSFFRKRRPVVFPGRGPTRLSRAHHLPPGHFTGRVGAKNGGRYPKGHTGRGDGAGQDLAASWLRNGTAAPAFLSHAKRTQRSARQRPTGYGPATVS